MYNNYPTYFVVHFTWCSRKLLVQACQAKHRNNCKWKGKLVCQLVSAGLEVSTFNRLLNFNNIRTLTYQTTYFLLLIYKVYFITKYALKKYQMNNFQNNRQSTAVVLNQRIKKNLIQQNLYSKTLKEIWGTVSLQRYSSS